MTHPISRRQFARRLSLAAAGSLLARYHAMAAPEKGRVKIRDLKFMVMQGPRTYTLVKVITDSGLYGIGEGYGNPGAGVKEQMLALQARSHRQGSARNRCYLYRPRTAHRRLRPRAAARRERHRDGALGRGRQDPGRARDHAARRAVPRPGAGLRSRRAAQHARSEIVPRLGRQGESGHARLHRAQIRAAAHHARKRYRARPRRTACSPPRN